MTGEKFVKKTFVNCRQGKNIMLPCNWMKEGKCGADTFTCKFDGVHQKHVREEQ